ncbi:MAG TPA: hypothetical protein VGI55_12855 [Solirubrobacteraceae bacterium]
MLFDLRSRGRRSTVRVIYAGLAVLMFGGLVLFGVGAGTGIGGLLNAFTNNASNSNKQAINQETKVALRATQHNPNSAQAWASMVQARWSQAGTGSNFNSATSTYTAAGKHQLRLATNAWERYLTLTKAPSPGVATLAARAYSTIADWNGAAGAWEYVANAEPTAANAYVCLAATAYAAKQTRKGDLAAAQAVSLAPKLQRLQLKQELNAAKASTAVAQSCG